MFIYPDSRNTGVESPITYGTPDDSIPASDRDAVQISISDSSDTVFGTVIPSLEVQFPR